MRDQGVWALVRRGWLCVLAWNGTAAAAHAACPLQEAAIFEAGAALDARAQGALRSIGAPDRRLLALRSYLRAGDTLSSRWSWSQDQLAAYPDSAEGKAAATALDVVAAAFASANPGFTLYVNRQPRSLELQVGRWNTDGSVGVAAGALCNSLSPPASPASGASAASVLRDALLRSTLSVPVGLAAPGLSAHGQGRAFDFQVEHAGKIVAGVEMAAAGRQWDAAGWTLKLKAAVSAAAGEHFVGPLQAPYEPWHYAYVP